MARPWPSRGAAALVLGALVGLNRLGVDRALPYLLLGVGLWGAVLASGVHATIAGVLLAFTIPAKGENAALDRLEHALHPWVAYAIMPIFALASAGGPPASARGFLGSWVYSPSSSAGAASSKRVSSCSATCDS